MLVLLPNETCPPPVVLENAHLVLGRIPLYVFLQVSRNSGGGVYVESLMKLKWPQIFGVSLSLELGKAATDLKPCTQCGHWPMLGMSIPCPSKYRFRPESGPPQQNIALQDRQSSFMHSVCCTLFHAT